MASAVTISSVDTLSEFGGTVSFDGTDITYTPPSGFVGIDRVFYVITDSTWCDVGGLFNV